MLPDCAQQEFQTVLYSFLCGKASRFLETTESKSQSEVSPTINESSSSVTSVLSVSNGVSGTNGDDRHDQSAKPSTPNLPKLPYLNWKEITPAG